MADDPERDILPVKEGAVYDNRMKVPVPTYALDDRVPLQNQYVSKLERRELEDRYLRLCDDNMQLKKLSNEQEDKIKRLATKLLRIVSDRKNHLASPSQRRDMVQEEVINEQQLRISVLEQSNAVLQDRLAVLKQQLASHSRIHGATHCTTRSRSSSRSPSQQRILHNIDSYRSTNSARAVRGREAEDLPQSDLQHMHQEQQCNLQEHQHLLNEVVTLRQQILTMEQEMHMLQSQANARTNELEEELAVDSSVQEQRKKLAENVELIRLKRLLKQQAAHMGGLQAHNQAVECEIIQARLNIDLVQRDNDDLHQQLHDERQKMSDLQMEFTRMSSFQQAMLEMQQEIVDIQHEKDALKEHSTRLLALSASAINTEQIRQQQTSEQEMSLRIKVTQLESSLAAEVAERSTVLISLEKERRELAALKDTQANLQSRYDELEKQYKEATFQAERIPTLEKSLVTMDSQQKQLQQELSKRHEQCQEYRPQKILDKKSSQSQENINQQILKEKTLHSRGPTLKQTEAILQPLIQPLKHPSTSLESHLDDVTNSLPLDSTVPCIDSSYFSPDSTVDTQTSQTDQMAVPYQEYSKSSEISRCIKPTNSASYKYQIVVSGNNSPTSSSTNTATMPSSNIKEHSYSTPMNLQDMKNMGMTEDMTISLNMHENAKSGWEEDVYSTRAGDKATTANQLETSRELQKCRELLRVQYNLNSLYKKEVHSLNGQLTRCEQEQSNRLEAMYHLLESHTVTINKLEKSTFLLESPLLNNKEKRTSGFKNEEVKGCTNDESKPNISNEGIFQMHIGRVQLLMNMQLYAEVPSFYVTWDFLNHGQACTHCTNGPDCKFDYSVYYKVTIDDDFLDFMMNGCCVVEIHMVLGTNDELISCFPLHFSRVLTSPQYTFQATIPLSASSKMEHANTYEDIGLLQCTLQVVCQKELIDDYLARRMISLLLNGSPVVQYPVPAPRYCLRSTDKKLQELNNKVNLEEQNINHQDESKILSSRESEQGSLDSRNQTSTSKATLENKELKKYLSSLDTTNKINYSSKRLCSTDDTLSGSNGIKEDIETTKKKSFESEANMFSTREVPTNDNTHEREVMISQDLDMKEIHFSKVLTQYDSDAQQATMRSEDELVVDCGNINIPNTKSNASIIDNTLHESHHDVSNTNKMEGSFPENDESHASLVALHSNEKNLLVSRHLTNSKLNETDYGTKNNDEINNELYITKYQNELEDDVDDDDDDDDVVINESQEVPNAKKVKDIGQNPDQGYNIKQKLVEEKQVDQINITIHSIKLKAKSSIMKNPEIIQLYVEYSFLGYCGEEMETPTTVPKPINEDKQIEFNFHKTFMVDVVKHYKERRYLANMLNLKSDKDSRRICFVIVSEPVEEYSSSRECEAVGYAYVDLLETMNAGHNLNKENIPIMSVDGKELLGNLTISLTGVKLMQLIVKEPDIP